MVGGIACGLSGTVLDVSGHYSTVISLFFLSLFFSLSIFLSFFLFPFPFKTHSPFIF